MTARRGETFSLSTVMQGFKTSECAWSRTFRPGTRSTATAAAMQYDLCSDLVFWILDHFVIDLLRVGLIVEPRILITESQVLFS